MLGTAVPRMVACVAVPSSQQQGHDLSRTVEPPPEPSYCRLDTIIPHANLIFPTPTASPQSHVPDGFAAPQSALSREASTGGCQAGQANQVGQKGSGLWNQEA